MPTSIRLWCTMYPSSSPPEVQHVLFSCSIHILLKCLGLSTLTFKFHTHTHIQQWNAAIAEINFLLSWINFNFVPRRNSLRYWNITSLGEKVKSLEKKVQGRGSGMRKWQLCCVFPCWSMSFRCCFHMVFNFPLFFSVIYKKCPGDPQHSWFHFWIFHSACVS